MPARTIAARGRRLALAAAALALAGAVPARAATVRVTIDKLAFSPAEVTAHVGDTIEWVNNDFLVHTATSKAQGWDVTIPAKKTATLVVKQAGTVDYICRFHPNMKGRLVIEK
ncbi:MAG TPA: cupredoxin family copper-binding protein [Hyphomicrobiales bacterium]|nr:cupredoxin family copper-binding protein [Hyphomicrobiales bacterium]